MDLAVIPGRITLQFQMLDVTVKFFLKNLETSKEIKYNMDIINNECLGLGKNF